MPTEGIFYWALGLCGPKYVRAFSIKVAIAATKVGETAREKGRRKRATNKARGNTPIEEGRRKRRIKKHRKRQGRKMVRQPTEREVLEAVGRGYFRRTVVSRIKCQEEVR